ncbi:MAG: type II secretion system minor pseudopilin GspK, partial [Gammaproteobacteria bacterium]
MTCARAKQRGVALVTAMFIIAIVATLAAFLAVSQQVWLRQAQNLADLGQADGIVRGAIELAGIALVLDARNNKFDALDEEWSKPVVLPVEGGFVTIEAKDAQSQFNLNNLVTGTAGNRTLNPTEIAVFEQLLVELGLDANLKGALIDWLDSDSNVQPGGGAEDLDYVTQPTPYRTANGP